MSIDTIYYVHIWNCQNLFLKGDCLVRLFFFFFLSWSHMLPGPKILSRNSSKTLTSHFNKKILQPQGPGELKSSRPISPRTPRHAKDKDEDRKDRMIGCCHGWSPHHISVLWGPRNWAAPWSSSGAAGRGSSGDSPDWEPSVCLQLLCHLPLLAALPGSKGASFELWRAKEKEQKRKPEVSVA